MPRNLLVARILVALAACSPGVLGTTLARGENKALPPETARQAERELAAVWHPSALRLELFAADPQLGNPVALTVSERGDVFVAEEYRFNRGTEENRTSPWLLEDDLQIKSLADRMAMYRKHAHRYDGGMKWFSRYADKVRKLRDRDGDGRADDSSEFAKFQEPLDGLAAGILAYHDAIYVTCIPHLWKLQDRENARQAVQQEKLLTGFGVNAGFLGHDLHALTWGPEGKLYFSVGDRGYHVATREGKVLSDPRTGSIFRCNPDGTEFEAIYRGLRNPQGIAFDEFGNLFAADNNCDKGDASRLMYIVEGGDGGWRMEYQSIPAPYLTGPWLAERMWTTDGPGRPAFSLPPVGGIGSGPSGFAYYPGVGLPPEFAGTFILCNFVPNGGLEALRVKPKGAGFELHETTDLLKPINASDIAFGYDGKLYLANFLKLIWNGGDGGGRILTLYDPEVVRRRDVQDVRTWFQNGFNPFSVPRLVELLGHADLRVRREAQFTLARKAGEPAFTKPVTAALFDSVQHGALRARRHSLWALGQLARQHADLRQEILEYFQHRLLLDTVEEIREQAAKTLGECHFQPAAADLTAALGDPNPRLRFFAALALARLEYSPAAPALVELLRSGAGDPYLQHAAVVALRSVADPEWLHRRAAGAPAAVRMGIALVERRRGDPRIADFLNDDDPALQLEAARAINDLPIPAAANALAKQLDRLPFTRAPLELEPLVRRAINANFRAGTNQSAERILQAALNSQLGLTLRKEAVAALMQWPTPSPRDRVDGFWRPLPARDPAALRRLLAPKIAELVNASTGSLQMDVLELIARLQLPIEEEKFAQWIADDARPAPARATALRLLHARHSPKLAESLAQARKSNAPLLRAQARELEAEHAPQRCVEEIRQLLQPKDKNSSAVADPAVLLEQQRGLKLLSQLKRPDADALLVAQVDRITGSRLPEELWLETIQAARSRNTPELQEALVRYRRIRVHPLDPLAQFRGALRGGDAERGRDLFVGNSRTQCARCHKISGTGGTAGPDLTQAATRHTRETLLESLITPDAKIAPGYAAIAVMLQSGHVVAGILKAEDKHQLTLELPTGQVRLIPIAEIEERTPARSAMPPMGTLLELSELRDLVEYLASLK